jgi:hypothetical protein
MKAKLALALVAAWLSIGAAAPADVNQLAWLAGHWSTESAEGWTEEQWLAPRAGMMAGVGRIGAGEKLRLVEFMRIAPNADGVLTYYASPGGERAHAFRLKEMDASSFTFERSENDFPQRIHYALNGETLTATISGPGDRKMSWTYRRVR